MAAFKLTPAHFKKFFATMNRATAALGLRGEAAKGYYQLVLKEVAHCSSIKTISTSRLFDECILRFTTDAGDFAQAIDYDMERLKRTAYVIKVMTFQIMQLQRLSLDNARAYFDAIVHQSMQGRVSFYSQGDSFYLDFSEHRLHSFLQILDTHLRKLKRKHFPTHPLSFNDRVRYVSCDTTTGELFLIDEVEKNYYANLPFHVRVNGSQIGS